MKQWRFALAFITIFAVSTKLWAIDYATACKEIMTELQNGDTSKLEQFFQLNNSVILFAGSGKSVSEMTDSLRPLIQAKARFAVRTKDNRLHPHNSFAGKPISLTTSDIYIGNEKIPWVFVKSFVVMELPIIAKPFDTSE